MLKKIFLTSLPFLLLAACLTPAQTGSSTEAPPLFVTSTLPPTKPGLTIPTPTLPTSTPTLDPLTPQPTATELRCGDAALLLEDVTYPDNTSVPAGEKFTKTWKFKNTGGCTWTGYTLTFVSGERMSAPDTVTIPETAPKQEINVSVDLVAPTADGTYQGRFELRNAAGQALVIGIESTFWVQIIVGNGGAAVNLQGTPIALDVGNCNYTLNDGYVQTLIELINQARAEVGHPALTVNAQLTSAAQGHSLDMACNNFLGHSGSDGSYIGKRIAASGYTGGYYVEIIAIGLPQDAMNQWKSDPVHWTAVLTTKATEIGVGYVFSKYSSFGGYWTVDMGGP